MAFESLASVTGNKAFAETNLKRHVKLSAIASASVIGASCAAPAAKAVTTGNRRTVKLEKSNQNQQKKASFFSGRRNDNGVDWSLFFASVRAV